jgi:hypothetical protein
MNESKEPEKVNQVISLKVTLTEKIALEKYCRNVRLSKSSAIRDFIRRGTGVIPDKVTGISSEKFNETLSPILKELQKRVKKLEHRLNSIEDSKTSSKSLETKSTPTNSNEIKVPADRLADKHLNKKEIAILLGISLSTLSKIKRYITESGEQLFKPLGKIYNVGYYDCSEVNAENIPERFKMNIDWGRLKPK